MAEDGKQAEENSRDETQKEGKEEGAGVQANLLEAR
jgi:hypothetical protein